MVTVLIISIFVLGYLAIAFEHNLKVNKAAPALITGVLCWVVSVLSGGEYDEAVHELLHYLGEIASILFFLLGAMTIVELIDSHNGFAIITQRITRSNKSHLLYIVSAITFFLSAILDNLTTAIVMTSLIGKLLAEKEDRMWFAGMIIIAANSGGAWSPLGDVTTTMLWIGGQITALNIIAKTIIPSLAVCIVPLILISRRFSGMSVTKPPDVEYAQAGRKGKIILFSGVGLLVFVPAFKTITGLPPFMGMLLALSIIWFITTIIHKGNKDDREKYDVARAMRKIDSPSILFFLGILLAVSALRSFGLLKDIANYFTEVFKSDFLIGTSLGILSAIVDNVPLVAAAQGMFDMNVYPQDHRFWDFLALTTGTGGSMIIIGSAAGVAVMGIQKIPFGWYLKRIGALALAGYIAGILVFILQDYLLNR